MAAVAGPTQEASGELVPVASELPPEVQARPLISHDGATVPPQSRAATKESDSRDPISGRK